MGLGVGREMALLNFEGTTRRKNIPLPTPPHKTKSLPRKLTTFRTLFQTKLVAVSQFAGRRLSQNPFRDESKIWLRFITKNRTYSLSRLYRAAVLDPVSSPFVARSSSCFPDQIIRKLYMQYPSIRNKGYSELMIAERI